MRDKTTFTAGALSGFLIAVPLLWWYHSYQIKVDDLGLQQKLDQCVKGFDNQTDNIEVK